MASSRTTIGFATAAALIALSGAMVSGPTFAKDAKQADTVHCYGVNSCKGTSDCKTAKNDCKGLNDCKGQGFKALTAEACKTQGGSQTEPSAS